MVDDGINKWENPLPKKIFIYVSQHSTRKKSDVHQFRVGEIETTSDRELVYGETEGQQQNMSGLREIVELGDEPYFPGKYMI